MTTIAGLTLFEKQIIFTKDSIDKLNNNPFRFAVLKPISIPTTVISDWSISEGNQIWQYRIEALDALSLSVVFDSLQMPDGAELFIFCAETGWVTGPITNKNFPIGAGRTSTEVLKGSSLNFFYREPIGISVGRNIKLAMIGYGYRFGGASEYQSLGDTEGPSGSCNVYVNNNPKGNCFSMEKRADALVLRNLNTEECSGTVVTSTNFFSKPIPYFLLADHCLLTDNIFSPTGVGHTDLNTLSLRFRFWTGNSNFVTFTGVKIRAENANIDMALLELNNPITPKDEIFFAGWDRTGAIPNTTSTTHHPAGDRTNIDA